MVMLLLSTVAGWRQVRALMRPISAHAGAAARPPSAGGVATLETRWAAAVHARQAVHGREPVSGAPP